MSNAEAVKRYRQAHPERVREKNRRYRQENPERVGEWRRQDYERHQEQRAAGARARRAADREAINARRRELYQPGRDHHLTPEQFNALLANQDGKCVICPATLTPGKNLHIDHDHGCCPGRFSCGKCIRGLLCNLCNKGLGHFKEDPDILISAAAYLLSRVDLLAKAGG